MSDLVISDPTLVVPVTEIDANTILANYLANVAIIQGQSVAFDSTNKVWNLADATDSFSVYGIAVNEAAANQPVSVMIGGTLDLGVTLLQGMLYVVSTTDGGICPIADIVTPDYYYILGYANDGDELVFNKLAVPFSIGT